MTKPIITIGIPARNEGLWLYNTLKSIRATKTDKTPELEVIVVDDASIDGCCDRLVEDFKDLNCTVLKNEPNDKHGTAVSKQRALLHSRGEIFICVDAHMVFQYGWIDRMYNAYLNNPNAFYYLPSTEFQAAEIVYTKDIGSTSDIDVIKNALQQTQNDYPDKPIYLLKDFSEDDGMQQQSDWMKIFNVPVLLDSFRLTKAGTLPSWKIIVAGDKFDEKKPLRMANYVTMLDYPEASSMIHPIWTDWYNAVNRPKVNEIEVTGIYGACYLFPKQLMLDKFGGWLPIEGWVTEENWIAISAMMTGVKIICLTDYMSVHLYARPPIQTSGLNMVNQNLNSLAIIEICFDEYKVRIQKKCFGQTFQKHDYETVKSLVEERKRLIHKNKVMTDNEFLQRTGLIIYFDEAHKQTLKQRIGTSEFGVSNMASDGIKTIIDDLQNNPFVDWAFILVNTSDKDKCVFRQFSLIECNDWNHQKNCRDHTAAGHSPTKRKEMCGAVHETIQGFEAVHFWSERLGVDIKLDHNLTAQMANWLHKNQGFKLDTNREENIQQTNKNDGVKQ